MSDSINNLMDDSHLYEQLTLEELFQEEIDHLQMAIDELDGEGLTEENSTRIFSSQNRQPHGPHRCEPTQSRFHSALKILD
jgi:hypothetical protein